MTDGRDPMLRAERVRHRIGVLLRARPRLRAILERTERGNVVGLYSLLEPLERVDDRLSRLTGDPCWLEGPLTDEARHVARAT